MRAHWFLLIVACLTVWGCGGGSTSPSSSPAAASATASASTTATAGPSSGSIVLHGTPVDLGCDSIGIDYTTMMFHIDPAAAEPVSAMTDTGVSLITYWPVGFTLGAAAERVVRDVAGMVVATDGETLKVGEQLHGYYVCLAPTKLYVMLARPGG